MLRSEEKDSNISVWFKGRQVTIPGGFDIEKNSKRYYNLKQEKKRRMTMSALDNRLRLLHVLKILMEKTDEDNYLSSKGIIEELEKYQVAYPSDKIVGERRSIYGDIEALKSFGEKEGFEIVDVPHNKGWRIISRTFETAELQLLVDAVRGAKFIPEWRTRKLIGKLEMLTSENTAKELHKTTISVEEKNENEVMLLTVDAIQSAINDNRQVSFKYIEITPDKKERYRKNGKLYKVSPWSLIWNNEFYYMLAHDPETNGIKHYRVDRIREIDVMEKKKREGKEVYQKYHPAFTAKTFGMYGGDDVFVGLRCRNDMAGVVIDRFGHEPIFIRDGDEHFKVNVKVTISPQFFGWLVAVGDAIKIERPEPLRQEYKQYLENILRKY